MKKGIKLGLICLVSSLLASCAAPVNQESPANSNSSEPTSQVITSSPNIETSSSNSDSSTPQDSSSADTNQPVEKVTLTLNLNDGSSDSSKITEYNKGDSVDIPDPTYGTPTFPMIYTFDGWMDQKNEKVTMPFVINENTTLTATWKESRATVTVTLDYDGGVGGETQKAITIGEKFTLPVPTKQGYDFIGWFDGDTQMTDDLGNSSKAFDGTANVTFKAHYQQQVIKVTLTLNLEGGTLSSNVPTEYNKGDSVNIPDPTRASTDLAIVYTFDGWVNQRNEKVTSPFVIDEDTTLTATWKQSKATVTVNLDPDGGTVTGGNSKVVNVKEEFTLPVPTKQGFSFLGWYEGNTPITDASGKSIKNFESTASVTLTAHYQQQIEKVTLSLNLAGGSLSSSVPTEYNKGDTVTIPDPTYATPTFPTIYTFDGWVNQRNEKMTMPFVINEDTTLTATWRQSKATVTVNLDPDGGTVPGGNSVAVNVGESFTLPVPTKQGFSFLGWYEGNTPITDASGNSIKNFESTASVTLTAHWSAMGVTVTLDYDGGTGGATTQSVQYGQSFKLPVAKKTGYIFNGWYNGNTPITDNAGNGRNPWNLASNTTLKANYTLQKITLDIWNGKALLAQNKEYDITKSLESVLEEVTKTAPVVVWGWYKSDSLNEYVNSFEDLVIDSNNHANLYLKTGEGFTVVNGIITKVDNAKIPATLDLTNMFYQGKRITGIGDRAFSKCTTLKSIIIPSNVVSLGESAFEGCSQLVSATLPEGLTELKRWAFYYCSALKTVNIPTSVKTIGWAAFGECTNLTSIVLPEGLTTIDSFAFSYNTSLTSINLPSTLTNIGENAFNNCTSLTTIFIPKNVVSMGDEVFNGCAKLTINCEIAQPAGTPTGWSQTWNPSNCPVNWGQQA